MFSILVCLQQDQASLSKYLTPHMCTVTVTVTVTITDTVTATGTLTITITISVHAWITVIETVTETVTVTVTHKPLWNPWDLIGILDQNWTKLRSSD